MAAFDAALFDAGIANYNLIRLSSIIPQGFEPKKEKINWNGYEAGKVPGEFGDKLYVVYASQIENEMGKEAWAGIGWVMAEDGSKKGLFTEHEAHSKAEVENLIHETLSSMVKYRKEKYGPVQMEVVGITCESKPVCALVAAVYKTESWN